MRYEDIANVRQGRFVELNLIAGMDQARAKQQIEGAAQVDPSACILCGYCAAACPEFIIRVT